MADDEDFAAKLNRLAKAVGDARKADVLIYSGEIETPQDDNVLSVCLERQHRREDLFLMICTFGGDPDAAYRIARYLKRQYRRVVVMVYGFCKSAGTLLVLGADELVLGERAELGPLDIQLRKEDELSEASSGLTPMQSLSTLEIRAYETFRHHFVKLKRELSLTTKTASDIACRLAIGMYAPIFEQIEPMRVGETQRANNIAWEYGKRLAADGNNLKPHALQRLVAAYPSHGFVIDRGEAKDLFERVTEPSAADVALAEHIIGVTRAPAKDPLVFFLNDEATNEPKETAGPINGDPRSAGGDQEAYGGG